MDDGALTLTFGATTLPEVAPGWPMMTLAVLAYNQEHEIRAAVAGALAQTHAPLEIVLSDDGSRDRTFGIMHEMAAAYHGPHQIRLRRNPVNLGLAEHINRVVAAARGAVIVVAAGDDISHPDRVAAHARVYAAQPDTCAVFSDYRPFPDGAVKRHPADRLPAVVRLPDLIYNAGGIQIGATYSYRRACFTWPQPLPAWLISEDRLLPFRAALLGSVRFLPRVLVDYRVAQDPPEVARRKARLKPLDDPRQFPLLAQELRVAMAQGHVGRLAGHLALAYLAARAAQLRLQRTGRVPGGVVRLAFLPLRVIRKLGVLGFPAPVPGRRRVK